jgi:hypothetical protein
MTTKSFSHSANYTYLDQALRARWHSFQQLEIEMAAFSPRAIEEYKPQRDAEVERLQVLNPDQTRTELEHFVDDQIRFTASPSWQFRERFDSRHMSEYVGVVMLAQALSEALINAILAIGMAGSGIADAFSLVERGEFREKWILGPKTFWPRYQFPRGSGLHETLVLLTQQRNALMHHKIELSIDNQRVLEGSKFTRAEHASERKWLRRFFSLPYDLADFATKSLPETQLFGLLYVRDPIPRAPEHALSAELHFP